MSSKWETLYQVGIYLSGGLVLLSTFLGWARTIKRYWLGEMNREAIQEQREKEQREKGDANEN